MNCPYCNSEMEKGVIQSPHEISWLRKKALLFAVAELHEGSVVLAELSLERLLRDRIFVPSVWQSGN